MIPELRQENRRYAWGQLVLPGNIKSAKKNNIAYPGGIVVNPKELPNNTIRKT